MVKNGKEYELFCKGLLKKMSNQGYPISNIQHNVHLYGDANTPNQVDIIFDYDYQGHKLPMIVECKDYQRAVSKDRIATLSSIANEDLQVNGVFFAKSGFQKGAIRYAQAHKIDLYKVTNVNDADWTGLIKDISVNMNVIFGYQINLFIEIQGVSKNDSRLLPSNPAELRVLDNLGKFKYQLDDEAKRLFKLNTSKLNFEIDTSDCYVSINNKLCRLEHVKVDVSEKKKKQKIEINAEDFIAGIFENATTHEWIKIKK